MAMPPLVRVASPLMLPFGEVHACVIADSKADLSPAAPTHLEQHTCS